MSIVLKSSLLAHYFFDLGDFEHANIFSVEKSVWEALKELKNYLFSLPLGTIEGKVSEKAYLINPELIFIGKGTTVQAGAYIQGPCFIGRDCEVRHGAYIRGDVLTGNGCVIGHTTELKHCILLNNAIAAHFAYLGDSILGNGVNLGAGVKCANLRLDRAAVRIKMGGGSIATGMRKLGLIAGDNAQIGCNAVSNPGTLLGPRAVAYPNTNFGGFVPADTCIKAGF